MEQGWRMRAAIPRLAIVVRMLRRSKRSTTGRLHRFSLSPNVEFCALWQKGRALILQVRGMQGCAPPPSAEEQNPHPAHMYLLLGVEILISRVVHSPIAVFCAKNSSGLTTGRDAWSLASARMGAAAHFRESLRTGLGAFLLQPRCRHLRMGAQQFL